VQEFIDLQFKAFKNCEDNIEFLAKDIRSMDEKILEVKSKLGQFKERDSGFKIEGIPIMKGSTLTFNIIDGEFDSQFFNAEQFEPMISIVVNEQQGGDQIEHTKVVKRPNCMTPVWKEILTFDIFRP
jgi:hypothetical protein